MQRLNPKSLSLDQMYGTLNPNTRIYDDGVVPIIMREVITKHWVVFDGPVDA